MSEHRKELFKFITANLIKGFLWFGLIIMAFVFLRYLFDDYEQVLHGLQGKPFFIYSVFFLSEMSIGLIPPEVIMEIYKSQGWESFCLHIGIMAVLSYIGGIVAFYSGRLLDKVDVIHRLTARPKFAANITLYKKYGGVLILIAAITPVPSATVSLISGALGFPFRSYLVWASPLILRFVLYGYLFWKFGGLFVNIG
jgi:membrane protein DedA with SNARE-associated domain